MSINSEKEKGSIRQTKGISALHVSQTEYMWWTLKLPSVITTLDFVHVSSVSLENRGAVLKKGETSDTLDTNNIASFLRVRVSLNLPVECSFTHNQMTIIKDIEKSILTVDKVTRFSVRPPQLLFVRQLKQYYSFFVVAETVRSTTELESCLSKTPIPWVDGCNSVIKLRPSSIGEMRHFINETIGKGTAIAEVFLFQRVLDNLHDDAYKKSYLYDRDDISKSPAVVVFSDVKPTHCFKFLLHLLYTMGEFLTEIDLFNEVALRDCFVTANILPTGQLSNVDVLNLLRRYIKEQLFFLPGGNVSFSNKVVAAHDAIKSLVLDNTVEPLKFPAVLMNTLTETLETNIQSTLKRSQEKLFDAIRPKNVSNLPLNKTHPFHKVWFPIFSKMRIQTDRSFHEQAAILDDVLTAMTKYLNKNCKNCIKNHVIMGKPGAGKSHVSGICVLFGIMNGLNCYVTSLAARRAAMFNCEHIHRLFCIGINKNDDIATASEKALKKLSNKPEKRALLMSLDVLLIEEIGLVSAELLTVMDLVLQRLRDNNTFFGGVFVLANGDTNQLPTIESTDVFLSPTLIFQFRCHFLQHFVRMWDTEGTELLEKMSLKPVSHQDISWITNIISKRCTFVDSWNDITDRTCMKVFGKKEAEREAVILFRRSLISQGKTFVEVVAQDEMCPRLSNSWIPADQHTSEYLDNHCREPQKVILTENCLLRLTVNTESLCQGQILILAEMPSSAEKSIVVYVAPNLEAVSDASLFTLSKFNSWQKTRINTTIGFVFAKGDVSVRRTQLPVSNYVALTCHKLMGDTFVKIATQVSLIDRKYSLWMASQLYVIISRVNDLKNITFVGCR